MDGDISGQPPTTEKARKPRAKKVADGTNSLTKTIRAPGSNTERVAQACDRCRAKKVKCDGKLPCSNCASTGLKCIVSDKLSRRSFPKGYTETLEERIRQLESENKKLMGLLDIRDEQLDLLNKSSGDVVDESTALPVTSNNLSLLNHNSGHSEVLHEHLHEKGCPCGCTTNPNAVHERPVSVAGSLYDGQANGMVSVANSIISDDDDESLFSPDEFLSSLVSQQRQPSRYHTKEVSPAPGAFAAATAIAQMSARPQVLDESNKQQLLTRLVAVSMPRSTEETLFIPTLIAKICQNYGYTSKPAILTANAIASLKESTASTASTDEIKTNNETLMAHIMNRNDITRLNDDETAFFLRSIKLPQSRIDMDHLTTIYFQDWGNTLPILNKNNFLKNYMKILSVLDGTDSSTDSTSSSYELVEKFGAMMVLILGLSLLSDEFSNKNGPARPELLSHYKTYANHYDYLIHEFIKPNCIITKYCSIQSLQILSLALQYCLATGDITTCYELRGRVTTMAQQLRLHRCPAAVLGVSGDGNGNANLQHFMQGERRILFWCIYCLDAYSSLNLGVPRLFKDFEIECALPFSGKKDDDDDDENENILIVNNTKLSIYGKVSKFSLSIMLYCKALGNILDSIFSRYDQGESDKSVDRDRMLDCWRRELPNTLKFEVDVNGLSLRDNAVAGTDGGSSNWKNYNKQQLTLIFLYYHAKILIYLPIISKFGNHHNVGLSQKEQLTKGQRNVSNIVSSMSIIQQSSLQILEILKSFSKDSTSYLLPIPLNIPREQARLALMVAKGSLDYMKGGPLHQNLKQLLLDTISIINSGSLYELPGGMTKNTAKLLELAILSILGLNLNKNADNLKKKLSPAVSRPAVQRDPYAGKSMAPRNYNNLNTINTISNNLSTVNSNSIEGFDNTSEDMFLAVQFNQQRTMNRPGDQQPSYEALDQDILGAQVNSSQDSGELSDGLLNILQFDPFKVKINKQFMNEFAADGSLGLVPFLDMLNQEEYLQNEYLDYDTKEDWDSSTIGSTWT